jgi:hypothetical protein
LAAETEGPREEEISLIPKGTEEEARVVGGARPLKPEAKVTKEI